eukprot:m.342569 g.342569  ORF g.342569 m.342569 type:complete len:433 (-) comp21572_c0_seq1:100-1398(-)
MKSEKGHGLYSVFVLGLLYFCQGLPFGFLAKTLPLLLRTAGVSLSQIGFLSWLSAPWMFKALWGPAVDFYGRKSDWVLIAQLLLGGFCILASFIAGRLDTTNDSNIQRLYIPIFCMNLAASCQDVAVDGLAIESFGTEKLGWINSIQVVGFKVGMLTGGGVFIWASEKYGFSYSGIFWRMASLIYLCLLCFVFSPLCNARKAAPPTSKDTQISKFQGYFSVIVSLLTSKHSWPLTGLILTYKLGEGLGDVMFKPMLIDLGISKGDIGLWSGVYGMGFSICGSLAGGFVSSKMSFTSALTFALVARLYPQFLRLSVANMSPPEHALVAPTLSSTQIDFICYTMWIEAFFGGLLSTCMFTYMMSKVNKELGSSHFALLATLEVVGKSFATTFSGVVADVLGLVALYKIAIVLSAACMLYLIPIYTSYNPSHKGK